MKKYLCLIPVHAESPEVFAEAFFSMYFQCKKFNIPIVVALDNVTDIKMIEFAYALVDAKFCTVQSLAFGNLSKVMNWYLNQYSHYDYIIRMDGDDIAHPDRLEKQINYLDAHNHEIDVLGTEMFSFWDNKFDQCEQAFNKLHGEIPTPTNDDYWIINHATAIIKIKSVLAVGGYQVVGLHEGQDTLLWEAMYKAGYDIRNVPEVLYKYRRPLKLKNSPL